MTLGERIAALRSKHHMSQGDLAERLSVSRQSISKWETNGSVPDLDKLIALSDLFQVSLDELIRGPLPDSSNPKPQADHASHQQPTQSRTRTQDILGLLLIVASVLCVLLAIFDVFNKSDEFILIALLLFVCGTICLLAKRYAAIGIVWVIGIPLMIWGSSVGGGAGGLVFLFSILISFRLYYTL